jgi:hypothetical protein
MTAHQPLCRCCCFYKRFGATGFEIIPWDDATQTTTYYKLGKSPVPRLGFLKINCTEIITCLFIVAFEVYIIP